MPVPNPITTTHHDQRWLNGVLVEDVQRVEDITEIVEGIANDSVLESALVENAGLISDPTSSRNELVSNQRKLLQLVNILIRRCLGLAEEVDPIPESVTYELLGHKLIHAIGGSDRILPSDIGAVATADVGTLTGPQGPAGATGAQGPKGDTGAAGAAGAAGAQGTQGATGAAGTQGATGAQGPQGVKGDTGLTGNTGATGSAGPAGIQGPAGADGQQGIQGPAGVAPGGVIRKTANQTMTLTAQTAVADMSFAAAANSTYYFAMTIRVTTSTGTAPTTAWGFTGPASATVAIAGEQDTSTSVEAKGVLTAFGSLAAGAQVASTGAEFRGTVQTGATAGTVQLTAARGGTTPSMVVAAGSNGFWVKLA